MNESFQNNRKIRTQITDEILLEKIWLGIRDGNITFKDDSLDFNISEIESVYRDCMRDQPELCEKTHDMYEKYDLYDNIIVMTNMGDKK